MHCTECYSEIKYVKKKYFSSKLKCPYCGNTIGTWDMTLMDYWYDFLMAIRWLKDDNVWSEVNEE